MFDAHVHLDFPEFDADRSAVLDRAHRAGLTGFLVPGVEPEQWQRAAELGLPLCVGVHPQRDIDCASDVLLDAARRYGAVGIGEFGLDRRGPTTHAQQVEMFGRHLEVADELGLPIVLHVVQRHGAALDLLGNGKTGMVHAFSGSAEIAQRYVDSGLHISVGGLVTRANATKLRHAVTRVPLERLLVETDAPDQGPEKGVRNEPAFLAEIVAAIAALRPESAAEIARATATNARRLFRLEEDAAEVR